MKNWLILLLLGILSIVAGFLALFNPFAASLTANLIAGWSFVVIGILQVWEAFREEGWGGRIWALLLGLITLVLGVSLVAHPLQGIVALTIVAGVMFLASGVAKVILSFQLPSPLKWALLLSGVVSAILGFMVLSNMPSSAVVTLGLLLAVELLSNGAALVALAFARKQIEA
ncbi:HdeD family acid-resistance protein [Shimia biformata]|uniref:HdeD family acid-resistance protein n=1 Tax=Shimia biformata TaxID=1294299 RepID=UPI00194F7C1D|nr:DUF308 domain-containing protein [Shimia biformata]